jgi:predicted DCC family thiol-disulfide oxidoreductase YuxK
VERPVVFFDTDCGFCRWSAGRVRAWDRGGRLRFASIQGSDGDRALGDLDPDARYASWHLVEHGRVWSAGAALTRMLRYLPAGGPLATLTGAFPDLTERTYRLVARNRGRLGRAIGQHACSVDPAGTSDPP